MEDQALVWIGVAGIAGVIAWKYLNPDTAISLVAPATSTGLVPPVATVVAQTAQLSQPATGVQTVAVVPSVAAPVQASTQPVVVPVVSQATLQAIAAQQQLIAQQAAMSQGLPSVINPKQAGALLQLSQSFVDGLKMGSSVGTSFGTFSLQGSGFITIDKVDPFGESQLVKNYGSMTWDQYRAAVGLSGLGNFIRRNY